MTAGDVGVNLQIPASISLQNATVTLTIVDPENNKQSGLACTVGNTALTLPDGTTAAQYFWAQRVTTATDFPVSGTYTCQLVANFGGGAQVYGSNPFTVTVSPRL